MSEDFESSGGNAAALFTLKLHRGEGMVLLGMDWKEGQPADNFVGFAIEYQEPGASRFFPISNRLTFEGTDATKDPEVLSSLQSPFQKWRWVHFPFHADLPGKFVYRVTPVFMDENDILSYGEAQDAAIELARERPTLASSMWLSPVGSCPHRPSSTASGKTALSRCFCRPARMPA